MGHTPGLTLGLAALYLFGVSDLRHTIALCACLLACGRAQQPHAAFSADDEQRSAKANSEATPAVTGASLAPNVLSDVTAAALDPSALEAASTGCPAGMARIDDYCIDRYEAYVVELDAQDREIEHSPYRPVDGLRVRAKVAEGVFPQGYISQVQAAAACQNAGKRLCTAPEFSLACRGARQKSSYPYGGTRHEAGRCNEGKGSAVSVVFGQAANFGSGQLNDPRLNQWSGGLAKTGAYAASVSPFGVFDLVGNLHEWSAEVAPNGHGYFRGGFYGDAEINGSGCSYVTKAHAASYHDYSTGFRCCQSPSE